MRFGPRFSTRRIGFRLMPRCPLRRCARLPRLRSLQSTTTTWTLYRAIVADCLRVVDFLHARREVDQKRIAIVGDDLALMTAALATGIDTLYCTPSMFYATQQLAQRTLLLSRWCASGALAKSTFWFYTATIATALLTPFTAEACCPCHIPLTRFGRWELPLALQLLAS